MNSETFIRALGPDALVYIRGCMENGKPLSTLLLKNLELDTGTVHTFLPPNISDDWIRHYDWGIISLETKRMRLDQDKSFVPFRAIDHLVQMIQNFLTEKDNRICLCENFNSDPTDPWLSKAKSHFAFHRESVYHILQSSFLNPEKIETAIDEAESVWGLIIAMTSLPKPIPFGHKDEISEEDMITLADRTEKVATVGYDGEGYLIWTSSNKKGNGNQYP